MQAQFLYNPPDKGLYCHAPTLLQRSSGELLAAWYAYPDEEHIDASLVLARRKAGQSQWDPGRGVLDIFDYSVGNPVLFEDPSGTTWLLFVVLKGNYWNDAVLQGSYSTDGGNSWSAPITLWHSPGMMIRHPPVLLADGSLLLPAYDEPSRQTVLLASHSPHRQWTEVYRFADPPLIQGALMHLAPRELVLFFRPTAEPRQIWRSRSDDSGTTWSTPVRTPLPTPYSGIAAFLVRGQIAVVYNHTTAHHRQPLSISRSRDGGVTWSDPWHFEAVPQEVCYPSFLCDRNECIHGVYTYNRRMIKYVSFSADRLDGT